MRQEVYVKFAEALDARCGERIRAVKSAQQGYLRPDSEFGRGALAGSSALVGGHMAVNALRGDKPFLSRLMRLLAGVGIGYGGVRYATDPGFRDQVGRVASDAVGKLKGYASDAIGYVTGGFPRVA